MKNIIKQIIKESIKNNKIICDNCGWSWNINEGGKDLYVCHKCGHDNNPNILNEKCWKGYTQKGMKTMFGKQYPNCVKKINEQLENNVIFLPYSDDYNDELEDYDIDEYDAYEQTQKIAEQNNLNILRDKNLKGILFDTSNNQIVGALWTSDDNNSFSFDIAIDKQYQGLKLSHLLIQNAIEEYNIQSDYGNFNLPMKVDVINPMLANILKTKYNFRVVKRISNDRVIMSLKKNLNEQEDYRSSHKAPSKEENASLDNLTNNIYPADIYSNKALQYYGDGHPFDRLAIAIMQSARNKPNKLIKIYRAVPDFNYQIKQKIKQLLKINQYYDKFNFLPMNNNIIDNLKKYDYPIEKYSYDEQTKLILQDIFNQINELKTKLQNTKLTINSGDWVTITPQYANLHGQAHLNNKYKIISKTVPAHTLYTDGNSIHEFGYNP